MCTFLELDNIFCILLSEYSSCVEMVSKNNPAHSCWILVTYRFFFKEHILYSPNHCNSAEVSNRSILFNQAMGIKMCNRNNKKSYNSTQLPERKPHDINI